MNKHFLIKFVLVTLLLVTPSLAIADGKGAYDPPQTDGAIIMGIEKALDGLSGEYAVDSHNGEVTLIGTMKDQESVNLAIQRARAVNGVIDVKNELRVDPAFQSIGGSYREAAPAAATGMTDSDIASNVRYRLRPYKNVSVGVDNGTAILSGQVSTYEDKERVGRMASQVGGVRAVKNDVDVEMGEGE